MTLTTPQIATLALVKNSKAPVQEWEVDNRSLKALIKRGLIKSLPGPDGRELVLTPFGKTTFKRLRKRDDQT